MSDNINYDMQFAPFEENVDSIDWAAAQDEVMQEPWLQFDDYDWSGCGTVHQGAEALPGVGTTPPEENSGSTIGSEALPTILGYTYMLPTLDENFTLDPASEVLATTQPIGDLLPTPTSPQGLTCSDQELWACDFEGCKAKPFKRCADLNRHKRIHGSRSEGYSCSAVGCTRVGLKGFYREDKLRDHMIAGHTSNDPFGCNYSTCSIILPRDLMAVHSKWSKRLQCLKTVRSCPMTKCSFRVNLFRPQSRVKDGKGFYIPQSLLELDDLQSHLRTVHETRSREKCADHISARGYHAASVNVICPVCVEQPQFQTHTEFYSHFMDAHFHGPTFATLPMPTLWNKYKAGFDCDLDMCTFVPDEVRQHRRTLLSLWPAFEAYPVWDDIEKCTYL